MRCGAVRVVWSPSPSFQPAGGRGCPALSVTGVMFLEGGTGGFGGAIPGAAWPTAAARDPEARLPLGADNVQDLAPSPSSSRVGGAVLLSVTGVMSSGGWHRGLWGGGRGQRSGKKPGPRARTSPEAPLKRAAGFGPRGAEGPPRFFKRPLRKGFMGGSGVSGGWTGREGDCFSPPCTECAPALLPEDRDVPPNDPSGTCVFIGAVETKSGRAGAGICGEGPDFTHRTVPLTARHPGRAVGPGGLYSARPRPLSPALGCCACGRRGRW